MPSSTKRHSRDVFARVVPNYLNKFNHKIAQNVMFVKSKLYIPYIKKKTRVLFVTYFKKL